MGRLKPIKFTVEQFQDQADWIGALFSSLNQFINDVVISYNNNITISDNLYQEIKEIKFKNTATNFPLKFKTKFNVFPQSVTLGYIFDNTVGAYASGLTAAPFMEWTFSNGDLIINSISGLTSATTYTIRVHVVYG